MNQHIEIEYKILLTKQKFNEIQQAYPQYETYQQTNYYFSHPLFEEKKYMLRIREKNKTYELTLKRPYQGQNVEMNVPLTLNEKNMFFQHHMIDNEITQFLIQEGINLSSLQQLFSLTTQRYDVKLPEGILSLDESHYLGQVDYELEFEVYDANKGFTKFQEIIKKFDLHYEKNCLGKVRRAMFAYQKIKESS